MIRFQAFASGSNGNCTFIEKDDTRVLIDAGISCKRIEACMEALGLSSADLSAVLITHEHSDHVAGLYTLAKHYHIPVYCTEETVSCLQYADKRNCVAPELYHEIRPDVPFTVGAFQVLPLPTHHDAVHPVCYRLSSDEGDLAVMTDTGIFDDHLVDSLQHLRALLLESNHDVRMLEAGTYPYALKRRSLGQLGHLSNENASAFLKAVISRDLELLVLGHLSEENNLPELVQLEFTDCLHSIAKEKLNPRLKCKVALRYEKSDLFEL